MKKKKAVVERPTTLLTQVYFEPADFPKANAIAERLGYKQYVYTSTSALWGVFCLPENPEYAKRGERTEGGCIIKTLEFGLMFVQTMEDLHITSFFTNGQIDG